MRPAAARADARAQHPLTCPSDSGTDPGLAADWARNRPSGSRTTRARGSAAAGSVLAALTALGGLAASAGAAISLSWDETCPVFFQPLSGETSGTLSGTVTVGPGEQITHYTFYNAFTSDGESLEAWFTPEFQAFIDSGSSGSFSGEVIEFVITPSSSAGLYDQNPYDLQNPFPYLQLHDLEVQTSSNAAGFEVIVVDQFPPVVDLNGDGSVNGADLGLLLGNWGCTGLDCPGDLNGDNQVDGADLGLMLGDWNP